MLDANLLRRSLEEMDGFLYQPPPSDAEAGVLYANDSLACLVSLRGDYLHCCLPVNFCDEPESEDFHVEAAGDDEDFYREQAQQFRYFLQAGRYAGASRGLSVSCDDDSGAILLNCKAHTAMLTVQRLQSLLCSLFVVVARMRMELFPDEIDPEVAQLAAGDAPAPPPFPAPDSARPALPGYV